MRLRQRIHESRERRVPQLRVNLQVTERAVKLLHRSLAAKLHGNVLAAGIKQLLRRVVQQ
jgi:hypothetical protein